ncbi:hypothetical protein, unlikely [Trypanosoma brucei gambiense DAL972]|uniref:Uncharacterized protein n=1 Tax=Trypanosoma brucei gambiense (strain MHOM/CI/86/DAL972) TaxID=679716 RepID=D0A9R6_TRYB9|nr:hypothetical protein, unlikely [Trypanosoma brucei gambiense DAL972]CBH18417.1 hypothetical protein, unlikely [Trypanosoma brucei gambiense DAL972]|eukprot:XP_011780681.1 hypothetical protein, unlikely [Trypanosoma brucei gambiense DAL972]
MCLGTRLCGRMYTFWGQLDFFFFLPSPLCLHLISVYVERIRLFSYTFSKFLFRIVSIYILDDTVYQPRRCIKFDDRSAGAPKPFSALRIFSYQRMFRGESTM